MLHLIVVKFLFRIAAISIIYYLSAKFGLSLAYGIKQVTLVWPPTGISIAILLLVGRKYWPGIWLGAFLVNLATETSLFQAFGIATGNALEAYVATYLLQRFGFERPLAKVRDVILFVLIAVTFSPMISATIGTASLIFGGIGSWSNYFPVWLTWWVGDAIGAIVVGAFILSWSILPKFKFNFYSFFEIAILTVLTGFVSILVFTPFVSPLFSMHPYHFEYAILPVLFWVAYRFGQKGYTLGILAVCSIAIWGTLIGNGPFMLEENPEQSLFLLQLFIGMTAVTGILFSAVIEKGRKADQDLTNSEKKFRALIENSSDVIVLIDAKGIIRYTSPSTYRVLEFAPEELLGTSAFDRIYQPDKLRLMNLFQKLITEPGKTIRASFRLVRRDQKIIWVEGIGTNLLADPSVSSVIINYRDVTEHKKLDEAKTEFVSLAAHELRSPISSIRWYTEALLGMRDHSKEKESSYTEEIYSSVLKMSEVVNMLLNVSKIELGTLTVEPAAVDLVKLSDEVLKGFDSDMDWKKLKLNKKYVTREIILFTDPKLVRIVLENFISNSVKYTNKGGEITVTLQKGPKDVTISIKDTGVGIPEGQRSKVFTKSFRGDNVKGIMPEGTGLGLYLVKNVVDILGGTVSFESKEGVGTTFVVTLPTKTKKQNAAK